MTEIPGMVSTVVPVFNRPAMLRDAVDQVLGQTYRPIEIIVVDDGSTDDTPAVCASLSRAHPEVVRVLRRENGGPGAARETGRLAVRGEFVQYLDSDDWIHPEKFARQVALLAANPGCGVAYCPTSERSVRGAPSGVTTFRTGEALPTLFPFLLSGRIWQTITPLYRRSVVESVGPWSTLRQEEDIEYDARVGAAQVRLAWCPETLAELRHHRGPRAGGGGGPVVMRERARSHRLVYQHALRAGVGADDPHRQRYARELFLLARQCGAAGLGEEARQLFALSREACGPGRSRGLDYTVYRVGALVLGWRNAGRLSCWVDSRQARPAPGLEEDVRSTGEERAC